MAENEQNGEKRKTLQEIFEEHKARTSRHGLTKQKFDFENDSFRKLKNNFCKNEATFELFHTGGIVTIVMEGQKPKKYGNYSSPQGLFIPKLTNKLVKERIESGLYMPKNQDPFRYRNNTIMFNSEGIKNSLFTPCVSVDITGCYWKTAFNLGVIDEKLYQKGIAKDREYKAARNIAIGSIGALTIHEKYVEGKLVLHELNRKFGACARLDIIDAVWDMAQRIGAKLGPDFLMFLTDCFFVPASREKDVIKYLKEEGYDSKCEKIVFTQVDEMKKEIDNPAFFTQKVWWVKAKDPENPKFHDFSNKHNKTF